MTATYAQHTHHAASLDSIRVADAMHRGVITCRPDTSLHTVARIMAAHRIHAVVVAPGPDWEEWGLVSDLDLAGAAVDGLLDVVAAGRVVSTPNVFVRPDDMLARVAQLMRDYGTHHLVVLDRRWNRPIGIVSTLDLADALAELPQVPNSDSGGST